MGRIDRVITEFVNTPWAIMPEKLSAMMQVLELRSQGIRVDEGVTIEAQGPGETEVRGGTAVIPVQGIISHRMGLLQAMSGGTSTERLVRQVRDAVNDESVGSVLLNIDSPGGSVAGLFEAMDEIRSLRGSKPIVAIANTLAASAAYGLAAMADEIVVTPSGEAGSVGVISVHTEFSKFDEMAGVKNTIIKAGQFKGEGNDMEPLSDEAKDFFQARVDEVYDGFVKRIAKGRGVSVSDVRGEAFGQGRAYGPDELQRRGMVDRIATFDATLARLSKPATRRRRAEAMKRRLEIEEQRA